MATSPTIHAVIGTEPTLIYVTVDDLEGITAAGFTNIRVWQDASSTGAFSVNTGTATLATGTLGYTIYDADGSSSLYYKAALWQTGQTGTLSSAVAVGTNPYYCTPLDVRQELAAGNTTDSAIGLHDEKILWDMCEEASRLIDDYKRVEPGAYSASSSTSSRYFHGSGTTWQTVDPSVSVDAVAVEESDGTYTAWTENTDFYTWPYNASANSEPIVKLEVVRKAGSSKSVWQHGPRRVQVASSWGVSSTVPAAVRRAARIQVTRWYKRAQQGWQDASASIELGQLTFVKELDPDVMMALRSVWPTTGAGI
jgi:hypothetical protein